MPFSPILCYVTDRRSLPSPESSSLLAGIRLAIAAGVDWIQIREKDLPGRALAELVHSAVVAAQGTSTRVIVNDRLDVAIAARAAGVHLGGQSLPVADVASWCAQNVPGFVAAGPRLPPAEPRGARSAPSGHGFSRAAVDTNLAGALAPEERPVPTFLIGASCHSLAEAQAAERDAAHYVIFGPIFPTPSKLPYGPPQGLARLEEVCRAVHIPVLAIGGVTLENAADCLRAGAAGVAAIRLFQESQDLSELVRKLRALPARQ